MPSLQTSSGKTPDITFVTSDPPPVRSPAAPSREVGRIREPLAELTSNIGEQGLSRLASRVMGKRSGRPWSWAADETDAILAPVILKWAAVALAGLGVAAMLLLVGYFSLVEWPGLLFGLVVGTVVLVVFAGLGAGLLGLSVVVGQQVAKAAAAQRMLTAIERTAATLETTHHDVSRAMATLLSATQQSRDALGELRDVLLMEPSQRVAHAAAVVATETRRRRAEIEALVAKGDYAGARRAMEWLELRHQQGPPQDDPATLRDYIDQQERQQRLQAAEQLAEQAETAARHERWRDAHRLARQLVDTYPETPPATFARAGIETLARNAEIETRREIEERYKDLMSLGRHQEALALAEQLMAEFPESPQAGYFREAVPRLRAKLNSRGADAPP